MPDTADAMSYSAFYEFLKRYTEETPTTEVFAFPRDHVKFEVLCNYLRAGSDAINMDRFYRAMSASPQDDPLK